MENHPIGELMSATMQKIREMVETDTFVGEPIRTLEGVTIVPVSKVSLAFASGGADFSSKQQKEGKDNGFGGGSGAGVNIMPIAFLIIKEDSVRLLPVSPPAGNTVDRIVETVPEIIDKVTAFLEKNKARDEA